MGFETYETQSPSAKAGGDVRRDIHGREPSNENGDPARSAMAGCRGRFSNSGRLRLQAPGLATGRPSSSAV